MSASEGFRSAREAVFDAAFARCSFRSDEDLAALGGLSGAVRTEIDRLQVTDAVRRALVADTPALAGEVERSCAVALETTRRMQALMRGEP